MELGGTMKYVYAIGDIHGEYQLFTELLEDYDPHMHQLVLLGDLNDRGKQTKACFLKGKELVEKYGAIYLRGNHEQLFLTFLNHPNERFDNYIRNGGKVTLEDLLFPGVLEEMSPSEISSLVQKKYTDLITFLQQRPFYYEWNDYIFVHGGINLSLTDWRQTSRHDFMWIREDFHRAKNDTGKTIVFGHTPTPGLYGDNQTTALWIQDHKIGMDGGAVFGGAIHGVIFDKNGIVQDYEIQNTAFYQ